MWSHTIVATQSGVKQLPVVPAGGRWKTVLNGVGSGEHAFLLRDPNQKIPRETWRDLVAPWNRTLVVCWNDVPVYAGVIMRAHWDRNSGVLSVSHSELRTIFSRRFSFMVPTWTAGGAFTLTGKSLRGLLRGVVAKGALSVPGDNWHLPVVLPGDEGGGESRTWFDYAFATIEDQITEIQNTDNGPDVHLRPRWSTAQTLEWELRVGNPRLNGPVLDFDGTAAKPTARGVTETIDGTKQLSGVFAVGGGSEAGIRVGRAGSEPGPQMPDMDSSRSFKSIDDIGQLDGMARAELKAFRAPTDQFGFGFDALGTDPTSAPVGSTVRLWTAGDEFMLDGWRGMYLTGMSGSPDTTRIGLEVA